tara:strand:+ start:12280 stop:13146 length:867 start_codon:yes stop_codon:yes gene_type:complete
MKTIVGLGKAGCNIADKFSQYSQYEIYKIDVGLEQSARCYNFPEFEALEDYENRCPNFKKFFQGLSGEILFVTSCGNISAASLRILEYLKDTCEVSVLYIRPNRSLLPQIKILNDNVLFSVLQEYSRSGLFERTYLIDNLKIEEIVGDIPVREYFTKLNEVIVSTIHMINVFQHSKSEMDTLDRIADTARISTFSLVSYEKNEEKMFFDLDIPRDKCYYYGVPEEILKTDGTLMKKVSDQLKILKQYDKIRVSYGIYSTNYDVPYIYGLLSSSVVQNDNFRLDKEIDL